MSIHLRPECFDPRPLKRLKLEKYLGDPNLLNRLSRCTLDYMLINHFTNASYIHFMRICWVKDLDLEKDHCKAIIQDPAFWKILYRKRFSDAPSPFPDTDLWQKVCSLSLYFFGHGNQTRPKFEREQLATAIEQGYEKIVSLFFKTYPASQRLLNESLLHFVASGCTSIPVLKVLISAGADLNIKDSERRVPLPLSSTDQWNQSIIQAVLFSAPLNHRCIDQATPLHYIAADGCEDVMQTFLQAKPSIEPTTIRGMTPLHMAAKNSHPKTVDLLLTAGAHPDANHSYKYTPIELSIEQNDPETVALLIKGGARLKQSLLHRAALYASKEVLTLLIEGGLNIETTDRQGKTPLYFAVARGNPSAVRTLLDAGANPKLTYVERTLWNLVGITAPRKHCSQSNIQEIKDLLEKAGLTPTPFPKTPPGRFIF